MRLLFVPFLTGLLVEPAGQADETGGPDRLVFVQAPVAQDASRANLPPLRDLPGSRIALLYLDRSMKSPRILTPEFESACSPVVSFDGKRIAFAGRKNAGDWWHIYEMDVDGENKQQIVEFAANCLTPAYLPSIYTLDDLTPRDQVVFASDAAGAVNESGEGPAWSLHTCDLTRQIVRRITFNLSSDFDPTVLPDGRVLYSSWQRYGDRYFPTGLFGLFAINTDGTDLLPFYGNHELPVLKCQPAISPDGWIYFVESDGQDRLGGGNIAAVNLRRNLKTHRTVASASAGRFLSPTPLTEGKLVVSFRKEERGETYGLYEFLAETGAIGQKLFDAPEWHDVEAKPVSARPRPKGRSSVVNYEFDTTDVFCVDCYISQQPEVKNAPRGSLPRLRVIEGIPLRHTATRGTVAQRNRERCHGASRHSATAFGPRRILGEVPVESDGSFHFRAPAEMPIALQLLDENGMAVATHRSWMWGMPKENRGCIGCHEDRELTPPNRLTEAIGKPAFDLTGPAEKRRTVDFKHEITSLIEGRCIQCHSREHPRLSLSSLEVPESDGSDRSDKSHIPFFSEAYKRLLSSTRIGGSPLPQYVKPGSSRESPLVWHLFGRRMDGAENRSEASEAPAGRSGRPPAQMPPLAPLSDAERKTFIEWIDLGAQWDNRPSPEDIAATAGSPKKSPAAKGEEGGM